MGKESENSEESEEIQKRKRASGMISVNRAKGCSE
jgi:hypothetical protein